MTFTPMKGDKAMSCAPCKSFIVCWMQKGRKFVKASVKLNFQKLRMAQI